MSTKADKLQDVKLKVTEVTAIMHSNIQNALERGEKIEVLEEKSKNLSDSAKLFERSSKKLRCKMLRDMMTQRCAVISVVCAVIIIAILVILFMTCGSACKP